jgi:hypothetical protein
MPSIRCAEHGLYFDPAVSVGCALCRRGQEKPKPARHKSLVAGFLVLGLAVICALLMRGTQHRLEVERQALDQPARPAAPETSAPATYQAPALPPPPAPQRAAQETELPPPGGYSTAAQLLGGPWEWLQRSGRQFPGWFEFDAQGGLVYRPLLPRAPMVTGRYAVPRPGLITIEMRWQGHIPTVHHFNFHVLAQKRLSLDPIGGGARLEYGRAPPTRAQKG